MRIKTARFPLLFTLLVLGMIKYLAEAWRDYSETEYILVAKKICSSEPEAKEFLKDKCSDFQKVTEIQDNKK